MEKEEIIVATISDIDGSTIEVTDYKAALAQAKECVELHEETKASKLKNSNVYYFADAHRRWNHVLRELEKLAVSNPTLLS
jgi:hypothetical protein